MFVFSWAPYTDQEHDHSMIDLKEYRILVCDRDQWAMAKLDDWEEKVHFVVELYCSEQEYNDSPTLARTDRQFRQYDIYGRRYGHHVELFADPEGKVPMCLQHQYLLRGCEVTTSTWPTCWEDTLPVMLNNAVMTEVVAQTNKTLEWAVITLVIGGDTLSLVPCSEVTYIYALIEIRRRLDNSRPLMLPDNVRVVGMVRKNHIVWVSCSEAFAGLAETVQQTGRIDFAVSALVEGTTDFDWTVPLIVPPAIKNMHEKTSKNARTRMRSKAKRLRSQRESVNMLEEDTIDCVALPGNRKIDATELIRAKDFTRRWALRCMAEQKANYASERLFNDQLEELATKQQSQQDEPASCSIPSHG